MTNYEEFEKVLLEKTIMDHDEFMRTYNPWQTKRAKQLIGNYLNIMDNNGNHKYDQGDFNFDKESFSWLAIDQELEEQFLNKNTKIKFPKNMHYGLPNHMHGNIDEATIFQCLINPNIDLKDKKKSPKNLDIFFKVFNDTKDSSSNFSNHASINNINPHIVDLNSSILKDELKKLIDLDDKTFKIVMSGVKKLTKYYYYLGEYFYPLLTSDNSKETTFKTLRRELHREENKNLILENIDNLKTCNLELFPFRSKLPELGKSEKKIGRALVNTNVDTLLFSARVILRRIALSIMRNIDSSKINKDIPIFIFRRYEISWKGIIKEVLEKDYGMSSSDAQNILNKIEDKYFYYFNSRFQKKNSSGKISLNNLKRSNSNIDEKEEGLSKEEYQNLKKTHGTLILEKQINK